MNEKILGRLMYEDIPFKYYVSAEFITSYNQDLFEDEIVWEIDFPDSLRQTYNIYIHNKLSYQFETLTNEHLDKVIEYIREVIK